MDPKWRGRGRGREARRRRRSTRRPAGPVLMEPEGGLKIIIIKKIKKKLEDYPGSKSL